VHNAFLTFSSEKMSKSLGNIVNAVDFLSQYGGEVARMAFLSVHYRSPFDFSPETVDQAITSLERIYEAKKSAEGLSEKKMTHPDPTAEGLWGGFFIDCDRTRNSILDHYANDLNTSGALSEVFTLIRDHPAPVSSAKLPPVEMVSTTVPRPGFSVTPPPTQQADQSVVVSVVGLVAQPGLVTLAPSARIADAVSAAGGPLNGADTVGLNLARRVADGEQIVVGIATPAGHPAVLGSSVGGGSPRGGSVGTGSPLGTATGPKPSGPLDLNAATVEQLDALPGVGPVTAAAIVAWRQANGTFTTVDQLGEVDGIGPARLEKLRPLVRV
jgi:competence protein ComEA